METLIFQILLDKLHFKNNNNLLPSNQKALLIVMEILKILIRDVNYQIMLENGVVIMLMAHKKLVDVAYIKKQYFMDQILQTDMIFN